MPHWDSAGDDPRVRYAVGVLLGESDAQTFTLPRWMAYAMPEDCPRETRLLVVPSGFFGPRYGSIDTLPRLPLPAVQGTPLLYGTPRVERRESTLVVHADVIASAYFLLTRYEEWVRGDVRDHHGRFRGAESLPGRAGFLDRAVVEEYSELLRRWAGEAGIEISNPRRRFSVILTHDVDTLGISRTPLQLARSVGSAVLGRQPWKRARATIAVVAGLMPDPIGNAGYIDAMERRLLGCAGKDRCQSVHFFLAGGRSIYDGAYSIGSRRARRAIGSLLAAGRTIGLHASYEAGGRPELVGSERAKLEQVAAVQIHRNRHHYLRWREPSDGREIAAAGISWDSTLGYADVAGFRLGVCHPVPLFDPSRQELLNIEEHPLIAMDVTLSSHEYMNLDVEKAFQYVCRLADTVRRHEGELVLLWHNYVFSAAYDSYHCSLYPRVLDYVAELMDQSTRRASASATGC